MRILFFPSDMGGGFGHIGRGLALAGAAEGRGHRCAFVLHNPRHLRTVRERFPVHLCPAFGPLTRAALGLRSLVHRRRRPLFTEFSGLDYQAPRDGLLEPAQAERRLGQYLRVVSAVKPDLLVGDTNLMVRPLAAAAGLPSAQLVRCASHPDSARLIWWKDVPAGLVPPRTPDLFNPLLERLGLPAIDRAEELLRGDLHLVPSIPEIEPLPRSDDTVHVGALVDGGRDERLPPELADLPGDRPLVYATLGGGAGLVGSAELTRRIVEACAGLPCRLVLATGGTVAAGDLGPLPDNVRVLGWAPGRALTGMARTVIFHGGYGTMMETLSAGRPALAIPFQSEQEGNARRLAQLGCGLMLEPSSAEPVTVAARWPGGRYTWRVRTACTLTADEIRDALQRLMSDTSFTSRAETLRQRLARYPGADLALDHLERLIQE